MNNYCDLTMEEIATISPNIRDMTPVKVDSQTTVFLKRPTTEKQIKATIKKYNKLKTNKLWKEKNEQDYQFK